MFSKYDGLFIANIVNEEVKKIAICADNKITDNLYLFDEIHIFNLKIPIVTTLSSPNISEYSEYKKAVKGLNEIPEIISSNNSMPIGFGASMKRPGIKNKNIFFNNFLTIGDNLTVAAMIESIKEKITEKCISKEDKNISVLLTGPTGFIGGKVTLWILENTEWNITVKITNEIRFLKNYEKHLITGRIQYVKSFDEIKDNLYNFNFAVLATHLAECIPPLSILKNMTNLSFILDVCTPNIYSESDLRFFKGEYCASIAVQVKDSNWLHNNYNSVAHKQNTFWPCFCELALAIKINLQGFGREELLEVTSTNIKRIHNLAIKNGIKYVFNLNNYPKMSSLESIE